MATKYPNLIVFQESKANQLVSISATANWLHCDLKGIKSAMNKFKCLGMIEASTTRKASNPFTRSISSTTPHSTRASHRDRDFTRNRGFGLGD
jgi:hypothetical protein